MNTQLKIQDRVMYRDLKATYKFTKLSHFEIVDILEMHRNKHHLNKTEFSKMAGLSDDHYSSISTYGSRLSKSSYQLYRDVINKLNENKEPKPVYAPQPKESVPTNNIELTEEMCINYLKATGKYKVSKCEIITNWVEI